MKRNNIENNTFSISERIVLREMIEDYRDKYRTRFNISLFLLILLIGLTLSCLLGTMLDNHLRIYALEKQTEFVEKKMVNGYEIRSNQ